MSNDNQRKFRVQNFRVTDFEQLLLLLLLLLLLQHLHLHTTTYYHYHYHYYYYSALAPVSSSFSRL